jgi:general secretion pathway protein D
MHILSIFHDKETIMQKTRTTVYLIFLLMGLSLTCFAQPPQGPPAAEPAAPAAEGAQTGYGAVTIGGATIQYDEDTGSLIVIADDETNQQIEKIITSLDKPVPQVLIKVLFLEVTHTKGYDVGVEASHTNEDYGRTDIIQSIFGVAKETRGGFYKILDDDLEIVLRAIAEKTKLEVLSRPSVLARNNQEATITVGQEVPFIRNSRITDNGDTINTIEYDDIGIILSVTPHITPDRLVEMEVVPEISTLTGETVPISETVNARVIAKRSAETRVVVENGRTVVIGGMMEDNLTETRTQIPILGDIPILGMLFSRKIKEKSKTELLIFLTPQVVENGQELRDVSIAENNKSELAPKAFSNNQIDKYIDNLN